MCVCVCVCVCERERERERECVCVCESERKRAVVDLERGCINHRCQFESMAMMLLLLTFFGVAFHDTGFYYKVKNWLKLVQ